MTEPIKNVLRASLSGDAAETAASLKAKADTPLLEAEGTDGATSTTPPEVEGGLPEEEHPDAYTGFHEDDVSDIVGHGEKPPDDSETLLNPSLEKTAGKDPETKSWLTSGGAAVFQLGLCALLIVISVYEIILKKKAKVVAKAENDPFDFNSIIIWNSIFSIILGCTLVVVYKTKDQMINKDSLKMFATFIPPGLLFGCCAAMQFVILDYIPPDVFKVLEQTRLLVVAMLARAVLGKRQTWLSWVILGAICLSAVIYSFISQNAPVAETHLTLLDNALNVTHGDKYGVSLEGHKGLSGALFPPEVIHINQGSADEAKLRALLDDKDKKGRTLNQIALKEELVSEMHKLVKNVKGAGGGENNYAMGITLTAVYVVLMCLAGVWCEKTMKEYSSCPFYIQKVYTEIPCMFFAIFNSYVMGPFLTSKGIGKPSSAPKFFTNPFGGWGAYVWLVFIFFVAKSWLSGIIVKLLSSLTKQLCSILSVVSCYFVMQVHYCNFGDYTPSSFWCPEGISNISLHIATANIAVMVAVMTYTMSQNQARQLQALKEGKDGGKEKA